MAASPAPRHGAFVRITHWITALAFFALLLSGAQILISHPRFYWGETGNVNTRPLFRLPIPSSRATVPTGYGYVLRDQNGWSRSLHFQSAWAVVLAGLVYAILGLARGHFRRNLMPARGELSPRVLARYVRLHPGGSRSYNPAQRLAYSSVVFVIFPLVIWTGLAMSPAVTSAFPAVVTTLGGQQSARTLHFFLSVALIAFVLVHLGMVWMAGFRRRVGAMITGRMEGE
jgi:thiosulfate reductase cytochrome b subunit